MDDRYPSTDDHQSVHLDYPYPEVERDLNRVAAAREVAVGHPPHHRARVPEHRGRGGGHRLVGCHPHHWSLPARVIRLRRGVIRGTTGGCLAFVVLVTDDYPPSDLPRDPRAVVRPAPGGTHPFGVSHELRWPRPRPGEHGRAAHLRTRRREEVRPPAPVSRSGAGAVDRGVRSPGQRRGMVGVLPTLLPTRSNSLRPPDGKSMLRRDNAHGPSGTRTQDLGIKSLLRPCGLVSLCPQGRVPNGFERDRKCGEASRDAPFGSVRLQGVCTAVPGGGARRASLPFGPSRESSL